MLAFEVGRMKDDPSHAVMRIYGRDAAHLDELLTAITAFGVVAVRPQDAVLEPADMDGVFPDAFYSTTNLPTFVRVGGSGCGSTIPRWTAASASILRPVVPRPWR